MAGLDLAISTPHRTCKRCNPSQLESYWDGRVKHGHEPGPSLAMTRLPILSHRIGGRIGISYVPLIAIVA